jgi:TRAP-type C4-dicarboxylate transport system permease small subunit
MARRIRALVGLALLTFGAFLALGGPAGAQQLVDAGKEGDGSGGLAFVLMVVMIAGIAGSLFFMDHVRRNRLRQDDDQQ